MSTLTEKKREELFIPESDYTLLHKVALFIHQMCEVQQFMESSHTCSFSHIFPIWLRIQLYLEQTIREDTVPTFTLGLRVFQTAFDGRFLREYLKPEILLPVLIHPQHRHLKFLDHLVSLGYKDEEIENLKSGLKEKLRQKEKELTVTIDHQERPSPTLNPFLDDHWTPRRFRDSEYESFLNMPADPTMRNGLEWWKIHKVAQECLSILGSSAFIERLWSKAKDICDSKRSSLKGETLEALIFLKGHLKV